MNKLFIVAKTAKETANVAKAIAPYLFPGEVVILSGKLASGKTYFVKSLAEALGSVDDVTSPTYAIANFYDTMKGKLLHMDAYRLSGKKEFIDLGMEDFFDESITVIEWGEMVADEFPSHLCVKISFDGIATSEARRITLSPVGKRWDCLIENLRNDLAKLLQWN
jgi:tRNA threonylcarbamoyladenosine biosynthesis protein TsaE